MPRQRDQQRHRRHEGDAEHDRDEAGAARGGRIAAADLVPDPHGRSHADAERHHEHDSGDLQRDLVRGERRGADPAHQLRGGREHAVFEQERARHRRTDDDQLAHQRPVEPPEPAEHVIFAERAARITEPHRRNAHADVDDGRREPRAEQVERRQPERTVDQRIGEYAIDRDCRERDPERGLRPVHGAHEVAQRHEDPARHHAPRHPEQVALGERRALARLPEQDQQFVTPQLHPSERHAEDHGGPDADAQRAAHHARAARTEGLCRKRGDRLHDAHADDEHREQHGVRKRRGSNRLIAEPADQRQIRRHHGDLAELRERKRQRELDRLGQLDAPNPAARRCMCPGG